MAQIFKKIISIVFPSKCIVCGKKLEEENTVICKSCFSKIEINNCLYCPKCGKRLYELKKRCHPETKFILAATASYKNEAVRKLIHFLKYKNFIGAKKPLAQILKLYLEKISLEELPNIIIPMPLYKAKENKRGFNQNEILAGELENTFANFKIEKGVLFKIKNTKSQTECKDFESREKNISGSFIVKNPDTIKGKNLIIMDDVFTSGATMKEAVKKLKEAGAKKVIGLVIAKTN